MLEVRNLSKSFGDLEVLKHIDLEVTKGKVTVIIGPSGSGKSTFLRCLNFLEVPSSGTITIDDFSIDSAHYTKKDIKSLREKSAMVFQNFHLFHNKTVLENVMEGLIVVKKYDKSKSKQIALDLLEKINMLDKKDVYPKLLSGGQKQRVAIARAIAMEPKVMLFDEPTSALDPLMVAEVLGVMKQLAKGNTTMVIVTHELKFAFDIADEIVFMNHGIVVEKGRPIDLLKNPKEEETKRFLKIPIS